MANTAVGISAGSGMLTYLNQNAAAIGVIITLASFILALVFYVLNYRLKVKATEMYRDEIMQEVVSQIRSEAESYGIKADQIAAMANAIESRGKSDRRVNPE
jgi:uncharacterized membrane protein YhiD involved in acid resistance